MESSGHRTHMVIYVCIHIYVRHHASCAYRQPPAHGGKPANDQERRSAVRGRDGRLGEGPEEIEEEEVLDEDEEGLLVVGLCWVLR